MTTDNTKSWQHLDLARDPDAWRHGDGRIRVLLVAINMPGHYSLPVRILALMANQSQNLAACYDVRYVEFPSNEDPDDIAKAVSKPSPDLIGFSINIWNRETAFAVASQLKRMRPKIVILVGGQEVTNSTVDYLTDNPAVDFLVDGEGERPFIQFLEAWDPRGKKMADPERVSGLHYRRAGSVAFTRPAEIVPSLDEVPSPILAGMVEARSDYQLGIMLEGARGCPFKCSFCFEGGRRNKVRTASIKRLQAEALRMAEQGATYFHIMDPILCNSDPVRLGRLTAVFDSLTAVNPRIATSVEAYAHQITSELANFFQHFTIVDVGLQTTHPETARAIHRPWRPERFKQGLAHLREARVPYNLYLICGLPFETLDSYLQGIRVIMAEKPTRIFLNELCVLNGTELRQRSREYAYVYEKRPPYTLRASKWMAELELQFAEVLSKIVERHYNLAAKAVYTTAPWLPKTAPSYGRQAVVRLDAPCSKRCPGCEAATISQARMPANLEATLGRVMDADVDIITGDRVDMKRLMHVVGQLTLAGAARIRLVGPLSLFVGPERIQHLVNRGVWHFLTFMKLGKSPAGNSLPESSKSVMADFSTAYSLVGHAEIQPALEVVTISDNDNHFSEAFRSEFEACLKCRPTTIWTVPENAPAAGPESKKALASIFWAGIRQKNWVKLPAPFLRFALSIKKLDDAILTHCEALDLISSRPNRPPCFRAVLSKKGQ